jgi:glycosyltransferase EpsD
LVLKILYVTTISNAINDFLIPHIKQLIEADHQVDAACCIVREPKPVLAGMGVRIYNVPFRRTPFHKDNLKAAMEIRRLVVSEGYDMVHTHTPVASFFTRAALRNIPGISVLYTAHGFHFYKGAPLKNRILFSCMEKLASRWTDGIITINNEDYQSAGKMKLRRSNAVYYIHGIGVDLGKFRQQTIEEKLRIRKEFGYKENDFILFFAAELNKNKHQDLLIDAVSLLKGRGVSVILLLAGEGELAQFYKKLAKDRKLEENIVFLGFRNDVPTLIKIADATVSSSRREGLPVNVMEAMATGLPLVVTDCRGNRDLVVNGENGFVVDSYDASAFANAVEQLYQNEELRRRFGKQSLEFIRKYSLEDVLLEMKHIYNRQLLLESKNVQARVNNLSI